MLDSLLQKMVDTNASDLFVTAGFPVSAKIMVNLPLSLIAQRQKRHHSRWFMKP